MLSDVPRLAVIDGKQLQVKYPDAEGWEIL
jgi:hypothetical protein